MVRSVAGRLRLCVLGMHVVVVVVVVVGRIRVAVGRQVGVDGCQVVVYECLLVNKGEGRRRGRVWGLLGVLQREGCLVMGAR